jgi:aspartate racemase
LLAKRVKRFKNKVRRRLDAPAAQVSYAYHQKPYPGRITVFQTSRATEAAWADLALGGVEFHVIPGTHLDIFHEPGVQHLAKALATSFDRAQGINQVQV